MSVRRVVNAASHGRFTRCFALALVPCAFKARTDQSRRRTDCSLITIKFLMDNVYVLNAKKRPSKPGHGVIWRLRTYRHRSSLSFSHTQFKDTDRSSSLRTRW